MLAHPDTILTEGKYYSYIECQFLGYIVALYNVKIIKIRQPSLLGRFIELTSNEAAHIVKDHTQFLGNISDVAIKETFNRCFKPCHECYQSNLYFLNDTITIAQAQITDIEL